VGGGLLGAALLVTPAASAPAAPGVANQPCPPGAVAVMPGSSIQAAVDQAGPNAAFCLKNGVHRIQVVRPLDGQSFYGEGGTILNGSRLLTDFGREGRYWVASGQTQRGQRHGECMSTAPACDLPEALFIDDKPLTQVLSKDEVKPGSFYFDYAGDRIYLGDDPAGHKVEATVGAFAFESLASNILIKNLIIEKYASPAQKGAIYGLGTEGWIVRNSEIRLNSGAGIVVGNDSKVIGSNLHHNGQTGIAGEGNGILIENNLIWANNIYGFDFKWEAGGLKLATSDGVVLRGNHVYDNIGPGLWCDIGCRNVVYEGNTVERNHDPGIFYEISFNGTIRDNVVRHNGIGSTWFWGADILIAASQDVEVYGNTLTVSPGGCGIMLIDQGRPTESGGKYKTRSDAVHENDMTFEGAACAGGASDTKPDDENFAIITDGNNRFDGNIYRVPRTSDEARFPWGHEIFDWDGLRARGLEPNSKLVFY
jgi:parallel beta-helix repeat protein